MAVTPVAEGPDLTGRLVVRMCSARPGEIVIAGELDLATRDVLLAVTRGRRRRSGDLYIDAGGISFVDMVGLESLLLVGRETRATGAHFEIAVTSQSLRRLTRMTGTDGHLTR
jgi:anti-anti-sigma regulatory factor